MAIKTTAEFFHELQKLIPELPQRTKSMSIHLRHDSVPIVECEFFPSVAATETIAKTFEIKEIEPKESNVTKCP